MKALESSQKVPEIDPQSIISTYEGHTIFSLFWDSINVYEKILSQLEEMEFPGEEDAEGNDIENGFLRRLYRILYLPTSDFFHSKLTKAERRTILRERA